MLARARLTRFYDRDHEAHGDNRTECIRHRARVRERESGRSGCSGALE